VSCSVAAAWAAVVEEEGVAAEHEVAAGAECAAVAAVVEA
jgi:hypothetical protein